MTREHRGEIVTPLELGAGMGRREMWRFDVDGPGEGFTVHMPTGAVVRHFDAKGRRPSFWAEVDPSAPEQPRVFAVVATGEPYPDDSIYRGTVVIEGLVWHLIEGPSR